MEAFLAELAARGVTVELADDGKLRVKGWPQATEADRERLRADRGAIVELLAGDVEELEAKPEPKVRKVRLSMRDENGPRPRAEPPTLSQPFSRGAMGFVRDRQRSPLCHQFEEEAARRRRS